jgi:ABC-type molybdate transport system substrate-binding protein
VKASTNKPLALQFLHYLLSDKGQAALAAHGFTRAADAAPDIPTTAPAGK